MKEKKILPIIVLSLSLIAITFYLLTSVAPISGIDNFIAIYLADSNITFPYLISRAINRCFTWNARIGEFLYYIIAPLPHTVHDICNTFFLLVYIFLIMFYSLGSKYKDKKRIIFYPIIIYSIILSIEPLLWSNFFWMADSCNHLWGLCILLIFFIPFKNFYQKPYDMSKIKTIFYCIFGFIAGTTSENNVPIIIGFIILIILKKYREKKKIHWWTIISLLSILSGYVFLMFNPSTWHRYSSMSWGENTKNIAFKTFFFEYRIYFLILIILLTLCILQLIYIKYIKKEKIKFNKLFIYNIIFFISSSFSLFIMLFSSYFVTRALLFISFNFLVLFIYLIDYLIYNKNIIIKTFLLAIAIITIFYYTISIRSVYVKYNKIDKEIDKYVYKTLENNTSDTIYVPTYQGLYNYRILYNSQDELYYNGYLAKKYNIPNDIKVTVKQFYDYTELNNYIYNFNND